MFNSVFLNSSGEGSSALSVPGHWCCNEEPLAEVRAGSRLLLLLDLCGRRQPSSGHPSPTAARHNQEAGPAGDLRLWLFAAVKEPHINEVTTESKMSKCLHKGTTFLSVWDDAFMCVCCPGVVLMPGFPVRHCGEGSAHYSQQAAAAALPEERHPRTQLGVLCQSFWNSVSGGSVTSGL